MEERRTDDLVGAVHTGNVPRHVKKSGFQNLVAAEVTSNPNAPYSSISGSKIAALILYINIFGISLIHSYPPRKDHQKNISQSSKMYASACFSKNCFTLMQVKSK